MSEKLAIHGGNPVRSTPFPAWPVFDEAEEQALLETLRSGNWWQLAAGQDVGLTDPAKPSGQIGHFQAEFAAAHDCRHAITTCNGTISLEVAMRALDIGPGDEVIVPAYTFIATATSVLAIGAVPIFADCDSGTWNLAPASVEAAITPRTRAIIPVHFGGHSADMDAIGKLAGRHGLAVIEDAAHAHGARWRGRKCGSLGNAGSFSFQASKNMTAGEGGAITTNDTALAEACSSIVWGGRTPGRPWYEHHRLGGNYRMTEFQGAILRVQLRRLQAQTATRDRLGRYLVDALTSQSRALLPVTCDERATTISWHVFCMRLRPELSSAITPLSFAEALIAEGIPCSTGYGHPLYRNPMFLEKRFWKGSFPLHPAFARDLDYADFADRCPTAERLCRSTLWLSQNLFLGTSADVNSVMEAILKVEAGLLQ